MQNASPAEVLEDLIGIEASQELPRLVDFFTHINPEQYYLSHITANTQRLREAIAYYVAAFYRPFSDIVVWDNPDLFRSFFGDGGHAILRIVALPDPLPAAADA